MYFTKIKKGICCKNGLERFLNIFLNSLKIQAIFGHKKEQFAEEPFHKKK